jgi:hypothetical protein
MTMSELNSIEYRTQIQALADDMASEAMADNANNRAAAEEDINDSRLHETIDGHQWVIYNAYNMDVIKHSSNPDYYIDNFSNEDACKVLKERGLDGLHNIIAFWCMYADVQDKLSDALDAIEEKNSDVT